MAHSLLSWTLAVGKSSKNRALKSLQTFLEIPDSGISEGIPWLSPMVLALLLDIKAVLTIPAHDRDIHVVELKNCPDTNPLLRVVPSLQTAAAQLAGKSLGARQCRAGGCESTPATRRLRYKDQAKTGGWMPLWNLPIPILRNGRTCTPSLRLPAHSVRAQTGNLLKRWFRSSCKASSLLLFVTLQRPQAHD
eukprot:1158288-Pelagomonas_calceolata.AAC.7